MKNPFKSYLLTTLVIMFWATSASAFKMALQEISPYSLLFFSSLISTVLFFIVLVLQKKLHLLKKYSARDILQAALLGLLNPFGYYVVLFKAYDLLPGQIAMSLNYGWPIALSLLSLPILKHTLSWRQIISVLIGFLGVVIIATRGEFVSVQGISVTGIVLALVSTVIWAVFWLLNTRAEHDPVVKLFWGFSFGVIFTFVFSPLLGEIAIPAPKAFLFITYISFFEMGITFILWLQALKLAVNTAKISNMIFITPFLSLLVLNWLLSEQLYLSTFAGLLFIITGIIFQGIEKQGSAKSPVKIPSS